MNCQDFELELGDYADGTLAPDRGPAVEAHLRECAMCRAAIADFERIRAVARALEPPLPPAHVWTRIATAFEEEHQRRPWWRLTTGAFAWRPIAAAAVMLVLLAGGTWLAWRQATGGQPPARSAANGLPPTTATEGTSVPAPVDPAVQLAEQHYTAAIGDLDQVMQTQGGSLDPETAKVVQANLAVIDQAIGQSRAALKSQPSSTVAQNSLFDALRSKVQLLQDTVALINEMRKGNQEGAARIMSGMNQ